MPWPIDAFRYHGSGFGYDCASGGWLSTNPAVTQAYSAPLGVLGVGLHLTRSDLLPGSPTAKSKKKKKKTHTRRAHALLSALSGHNDRYTP